MTDNELEPYKAFMRVSKLIDFIVEKFTLPSFVKAFIITQVWLKKEVCIEIDEKVKEIWLKK